MMDKHRVGERKTPGVTLEHVLAKRVERFRIRLKKEDLDAER